MHSRILGASTKATFTMQSKSKQIAAVQSLSTGMPKYCASMTFTYKGQTFTTPQVEQVCTSILTAETAAVQARTASEAALAAEQQLLTTQMPMIQVVRQNLVSAFETAPATLADLGVSARKKPTPPTVAELAARTAKAAATRKARGTGGKRQKAAIVGNVTGVTITPVTAPTATPTVAPPAIAGARRLFAASRGRGGAGRLCSEIRLRLRDPPPRSVTVSEIRLRLRDPSPSPSPRSVSASEIRLRVDSNPTSPTTNRDVSPEATAIVLEVPRLLARLNHLRPPGDLAGIVPDCAPRTFFALT